MSQSNLDSTGLPITISFDQAFKAVSSTVIELHHPLLDEINDSPEKEWDRHDPEEVRCVLANAVTGSLATLGIPEPAGACLEWVGRLNDLVCEERPGLDRYLEVTTDQGGED